MKRDEAEKLLAAWTELDNAARNLQTALPHQLTERAARLEQARISAHKVIWGLTSKLEPAS